MTGAPSLDGFVLYPEHLVVVVVVVVVLPLCKSAIGVFYSPNQQGKCTAEYQNKEMMFRSLRKSAY